MVNPGGSTAEPAVVSGHTRTAVVLNEALGYYHEIRELVVQGLSAQKERSDEDITEDVSGLGNLLCVQLCVCMSVVCVDGHRPHLPHCCLQLT